MTRNRPHLIPPRKRRYAAGLIQTHLTGDAQAQALAWIRESHRTTTDIDALIDRLKAAHETPPSGASQ